MKDQIQDEIIEDVETQPKGKTVSTRYHYIPKETVRKASKRFHLLREVMRREAAKRQDNDTRCLLSVADQCAVRFIRNPQVCPVMAVTIHRGRTVLMINAQWLASPEASYAFFKMAMAHEMVHLIRRDPALFLRRMQRLNGDQEKIRKMHRLANIAFDAVNNEHLLAKHPVLKLTEDFRPVLASNYDWAFPASPEDYLETLVLIYQRIENMVDELVDDAEAAYQQAMEGLLGEDWQDGAKPQPQQEGEEEDGEGEGEDEPGEGEGDEEEAGSCDDEDEGEGEEDGEGEGEEDADGDFPTLPSKSSFLPPAPGDDAKMSEKVAWDMARSILDNDHPWRNPLGSGDLNDPNQEIPDFSDEELEALAAEAEHALDSTVRRGLKDAQKSIGSLPQHYKDLLAELEAKAVIPWTKMLSQMVTAQLAVQRVPTMQRFNRRRFLLQQLDEDGTLQPLPLPVPLYPGTKRDDQRLILFAIDTSGSMSNEDVLEGLVEMQAIKKASPFVKIIIVQCDTHISHIHELDVEDTVEDYIKTVGRTSGGGTYFSAPFEIVRYLRTKDEELRPSYQDPTVLQDLGATYDDVDMIIYHTDGYGTAPSHTMAPGVPVIWTIPEHNGHRPSFQEQPFGEVLFRKDY